MKCLTTINTFRSEWQLGSLLRNSTKGIDDNRIANEDTAETVTRRSTDDDGGGGAR